MLLWSKGLITKSYHKHIASSDAIGVVLLNTYIYLSRSYKNNFCHFVNTIISNLGRKKSFDIYLQCLLEYHLYSPPLQ